LRRNLRQLARSLILLALSAAASAEARSPKELYLLHCAGCHRPHGNGALPEVPGLRGDLGELVQVEGGRDYLVRVPGSAQAPVTDVELQHIVNWILEEFNASTLPENFSPLTLDEVRSARANVLPDPLKLRQQLWQKVTAAR